MWWHPTNYDIVLRAINALSTQVTSIRTIVMTTAQQVSDLTAAMADFTTVQAKLADNLKANDAAIQAEIAALTAALGAVAADPAVQVAIDNIKTISASTAAAAQTVADDTAKLTASLPPA